MNTEQVAENEEGKVPHIYLEEEGAQGIFIRKNEDGELEIDDLVFSKDEIVKLRNFLNTNFGG